MAWGGWQCEPRHGRAGQLAAPFEELAELLADLAATCFAFFPLVRVDAQRGVGLSVAEPSLLHDLRHSHASMLIALDGAVKTAGIAAPEPALFEGFACDLAHEPVAVSAIMESAHERGINFFDTAK
jgi:hypothetical protein